MKLNEHGFSLIEMMLATALTLMVTGAVFTMLRPAESSGVVAEAADMQQRLRVAESTLAHDLAMAGAGSYAGSHAGPLIQYFAPVLPFRLGATHEDPVGTFATDRLTLLYVPPTVTQTTLSADLAPGNPTMKVHDDGADCPLDGDGHRRQQCGIVPDTTVVVFDASGNYDIFSVTAVDDGGATVAINRSSGAMTSTFFKDTSTVVEVQSHTYYLKTDVPTSTYQLMHYDGTHGADVPVVDHVVGLSIEYFGEPLPPRMTRPLGSLDGPWTTYGARPSSEGSESCVFTSDRPPTPKLPTLGDGQALVPLDRLTLTDGPWCPDAMSANRWDADLLRIRRIAVTLRVQSAVAALRGPAGILFAHGGSASNPRRWLPDQEIRFDVAPRNLNVDR